MKKLNKKGITTVEILVSFIIVALISASLFASVANFSDKRSLESQKLELNTYKNLLTKDIQDDLIKKGLINVTNIEKQEEHTTVKIIDYLLKDGSTKRLVVKSQLTNDYFSEITLDTGDKEEEEARPYDDYFTIYYGAPTNTDINSANYIDGLIEYPIPNFGYGENANGHKVLDLRITHVNVEVKNDVSIVFIGFYHPDFNTKYGINIVCPVNYN